MSAEAYEKVLCHEIYTTLYAIYYYLINIEVLVKSTDPKSKQFSALHSIGWEKSKTVTCFCPTSKVGGGGGDSTTLLSTLRIGNITHWMDIG